jgi:hypothetical protein
VLKESPKTASNLIKLHLRDLQISNGDFNYFSQETIDATNKSVKYFVDTFLKKEVEKTFQKLKKKVFLEN